MPYTYDYPRFALTVDAILFAKDGDSVKVLLIERNNDPFKGQWALPGGFVDIDEVCDVAVHRELEEETGVKGIDLVRVDVFDALHRHPNDRVVTVAYTAMLSAPVATTGQDDAAAAEWFDLSSLPPVAFDHQEIITRSLEVALRQAG